MAENIDNQTTVDGVRAVEMRYRAVFETATKKPAFYQSSIRLNSPDMGVLLPEMFMPVLESSDRCVSVFKLALLQTIKAAEKFADRELDFDWISVFMPLRLLRKKDCVKIITEFTEMLGASPKNICFDIPPFPADEDAGFRGAVQDLRREGYHTMLSGVGGEGFPLLRLAELEPEYVMLSEEITAMLGTSERSDTCVKSVISFVNELGAEPIVTGISSPDDADKLFDFECSFYTAGERYGDRAGSFLKERYIRRRNQE